MKKSVLDILVENYNVINEFKKLERILFYENIIEGPENYYITCEQAFNLYCLRSWKFRKTFKDFREIKNTLNLPETLQSYTSENFITYLELLYNVFSDKSYLFRQGPVYVIDLDTARFKDEIINTLIENLNVKIKVDKQGWKVLYVDNDCLDSAIENLTPELQLETIKYTKIPKNDLPQKRKQLAFLATEHYIEQDKTGYEPLDILLKDCTGLLNNLHIRHNNKTGKWETETAKNMSPKEAIDLCDIIYDKILIVLMLRKDLQNSDKVKKVNEKLKKERNK